MKIVSKGNTLSSPEFHERKLQARRKRLVFYGAILLGILVVLVFVSRLQSLRIKTITMTGAKVISADSVSAATLEALSGYHFWLVPKNNSLIYSRDTVKAELNKKFPRFSSVELTLTNPTSLDVSVIEREPFALYCDGPLGSVESSPCYFLDEQGFIFDLAPTFSIGVYFIYSINPALGNPLGQEFLPREEFNLLSEFIRSLETFSIEPLSVVMNEKDFELALSTGTKIFWPRDANLSNIFSNLESFLKSSEIKSQTNFWEKIGELDLRTRNKVFYRFRQ